MPGKQRVPGQRSFDQALIEDWLATARFKHGDRVTFIRYPELIGQTGIVTGIGTGYYVVRVSEQQTVYADDADIEPADA